MGAKQAQGEQRKPLTTGTAGQPVWLAGLPQGVEIDVVNDVLMLVSYVTTEGVGEKQVANGVRIMIGSEDILRYPSRVGHPPQPCVNKYLERVITIGQVLSQDEIKRFVLPDLAIDGEECAMAICGKTGQFFSNCFKVHDPQHWPADIFAICCPKDSCSTDGVSAGRMRIQSGLGQTEDVPTKCDWTTSNHFRRTLVEALNEHVSSCPLPDSEKSALRSFIHPRVAPIIAEAVAQIAYGQFVTATSSLEKHHGNADHRAEVKRLLRRVGNLRAFTPIPPVRGENPDIVVPHPDCDAHKDQKVVECFVYSFDNFGKPVWKTQHPGFDPSVINDVLQISSTVATDGVKPGCAAKGFFIVIGERNKLMFSGEVGRPPNFNKYDDKNIKVSDLVNGDADTRSFVMVDFICDGAMVICRSSGCILANNYTIDGSGQGSVQGGKKHAAASAASHLGNCFVVKCSEDTCAFNGIPRGALSVFPGTKEAVKLPAKQGSELEMLLTQKIAKEIERLFDNKEERADWMALLGTSGQKPPASFVDAIGLLLNLSEPCKAAKHLLEQAPHNDLSDDQRERFAAYAALAPDLIKDIQPRNAASIVRTCLNLKMPTVTQQNMGTYPGVSMCCWQFRMHWSLWLVMMGILCAILLMISSSGYRLSTVLMSTFLCTILLCGNASGNCQEILLTRTLDCNCCNSVCPRLMQRFRAWVPVGFRARRGRHSKDMRELPHELQSVTILDSLEAEWKRQPRIAETPPGMHQEVLDSCLQLAVGYALTGIEGIRSGHIIAVGDAKSFLHTGQIKGRSHWFDAWSRGENMTVQNHGYDIQVELNHFGCHIINGSDGVICASKFECGHGLSDEAAARTLSQVAGSVVFMISADGMLAEFRDTVKTTHLRANPINSNFHIPPNVIGNFGIDIPHVPRRLEVPPGMQPEALNTALRLAMRYAEYGYGGARAGHTLAIGPALEMLQQGIIRGTNPWSGSEYTIMDVFDDCLMEMNQDGMHVIDLDGRVVASKFFLSRLQPYAVSGGSGSAAAASMSKTPGSVVFKISADGALKEFREGRLFVSHMHCRPLRSMLEEDWP